MDNKELEEEVGKAQTELNAHISKVVSEFEKEHGVEMLVLSGSGDGVYVNLTAIVSQVKDEGLPQDRFEKLKKDAQEIVEESKDPSKFQRSINGVAGIWPYWEKRCSDAQKDELHKILGPVLSILDAHKTGTTALHPTA